MDEKSLNTIPVVIFCGGKGARLKEETEFKPKPMVTIGGKPMLWHIMKIYSHFGFNKFILCLGYRGDFIKDYFLRYKFLSADFFLKDGKPALYRTETPEINWEIIFADTGEETLTGERLLMVRKYIPDDLFMVTYGDGVSNININALVDFHLRQNTIGTITGVHPTSKYGLISLDENKFINSFAQKPRLNEYINGGFMVFKKEFFKYLKTNQMIEEAFESLILLKQLSTYAHDDFWHCMDTYKDYEDLNRLWHKNPAWRVWG